MGANPMSGFFEHPLWAAVFQGHIEVLRSDAEPPAGRRCDTGTGRPDGARRAAPGGAGREGHQGSLVLVDVLGPGQRVPEQACAGIHEGLADQALGETVRGVSGGGELPGIDGASGDAPAQHGVAHGHPAGLLGETLA